MFVTEVFAAKTIKLATLAPEGTTYANTLKNIGAEVEKATEGRVKFKIYYGGVAGDEPDVLRKVHVGQMHGAVFTGKTLGDIFGDIRAMEIPFNFYQDRSKAYSTLSKFAEYFNTGLKDKGFVGLGFYEIGQVYIVSTKKITGLDELKGSKIWSWEGDELVKTLVDQLKLVAVPLALPDVLSSLSTGIIDSAYAPPLGMLAMQWNTKVKYLVDFPVAYSVGALLVSQKIWSGITPQDQKVITDISNKYVKESSTLSIDENKQALQVFKQAGIEFLPLPEKDLKNAENIRKNVIDKLQGKLFSKKIVDMLGTERK
jgi:TRAP-type C4-dicarboxylate transport system substrate-binding protein